MSRNNEKNTKYIVQTISRVIPYIIRMLHYHNFIHDKHNLVSNNLLCFLFKGSVE